MDSIDNDDALFQFDQPTADTESSLKGKALSMPVPIPERLDSPYDIFDLSLSTPNLTLSYGSFELSFDPLTLPTPHESSAQSSGKGKEREVSSSPPLFTFMPSDTGGTSWPSPAFTSSTPGPSSYSSFYGSSQADSQSTLDPVGIDSVDSQLVQCRHRSFSNDSTILSSASYPFSKYSDNLRASSLSGPKDLLLEDHLINSDESQHTLHASRSSILLRSKGRSNSSPYPISPLDLIPTSVATFNQSVLFRLNRFDSKLPRELRIHVLRMVVIVHELEHAKAQADIRWSLGKACSSKNKWVGRDRGIRELVKFSRVSKTWRALVLDGQLWTEVDLHAFPDIPHSFISSITSPFLASLNLSGHASLSPETLSIVAGKLSDHLTVMQLTSLNLRGCNTITTQSLHRILEFSPRLKYLNLRGLPAVTNSTCDILSSSCPEIRSLDIGRCSNMDADGIKSIAKAAIERGVHLPLIVLRASGLKFVNDDTMASLGRAAPYLETLDLSYARHLHNSSIEAFVACDEGEDIASLGVPTVILTARQVGRDSGELGMYKRRQTRLRHLVLSSCTLLTDTACSNLAHSVPNLETIELAGIGEDLKDDGLIRLLDTTPLIRRIDLEDASDITDAVLAAITPLEASAPDVVPGTLLEHLVISYASNLSDDALLSLIQRCSRLRVLEADNTHIGVAILKEFVRLSRARTMINAKIVAVDCRGITELVVKELSSMTRPRLGWRAYSARKLKFLDGRDGDLEDLKIGGQDECDTKRVVLKTFYSWQTVDSVTTARDKRHKARRKGSDSSSNTENTGGGRMMRWWSPGGRRTGRSSPTITDLNSEGCRIM